MIRLPTEDILCLSLSMIQSPTTPLKRSVAQLLALAADGGRSSVLETQVTALAVRLAGTLEPISAPALSKGYTTRSQFEHQ